MFDINNLEFTKLPVIIYASPRTGCSVVGAILARKFNLLKYFNEPLGRNIDPTTFINYARQHNTYIIKTMAYDVFESGVLQALQKNYPDIANDLQYNGFKIRVRRKNLVDQLTSNYIARSRDRWMYNKHTSDLKIIQEFTEEIIPIDKHLIKKNIEIIKVRNYSIDNIPVDIDLDLWYEDFVGVEDKHIIKTPQPANYNDIQKAIEDNL
jgi:hypothetical protein